ncbi:MAG TPA: hypothetical protein PKK12_03835 [Candidatus Aminicenantes bacterium]|nr:hypothetical protein [Candidatus Aminicenantes bacterium]
MSVDLRIPKGEVVVDCRLTEPREELEGARLFLNLSSPHHSGPQTIGEYLAEGVRFVPMRTNGEHPLLLNLRRLMWLRERTRENPPAGIPLFLVFADQTEMEVELSEVLPEFHARPIDFFNGPSPFLCFFQDGQRLHVHRRWIARVEGI